MPGFNPDSYLAQKSAPAAGGGFNPDSYLAQKNMEDQPKSSSIDPGAALQGFGQGAAAGYLPQLQAAAGALVPNPSKQIDESLMAQGFKIQQPEDTYLSRRDAASKQLEDISKENPGSYYGGMLGGALASSPAYSGLLEAAGAAPAAAEAGLGSKMLQAAKGGALMGAVQNPGDVQGQINPVQANERIENTAMGGGLGAATQALASGAQGLVKKIQGVPDFIKDWGSTQAAKSIGAKVSDIKSSFQYDPADNIGKTIKNLGDFAYKNGIVKGGDTLEDVVNRSGEMKNELGAQLGAVYDKAKSMTENPEVIKNLPASTQAEIEKTELAPQKLANEYMSQIRNKYIGSPKGDQIVNVAENLAQNLAQNPAEFNIKDLHDFKSGVQDIAFKADAAFKRAGVVTPGSEANEEMLQFLRDKINSRVQSLDHAFGGSLSSDLPELNKKYHMVSQIHSMSKSSLGNEIARQFFSPTDKAGGMVGAGFGAAEGYKEGGVAGAIKGGLIGAAAAPVLKLGRTFAQPIVMNAAQASAPFLQNVPGFGIPQATNAAAAALSNPAAVGRMSGLLNQQKVSQPQFPDYSTVPGRRLSGK